MEVGPLVVGVDASSDYFRKYGSGIISDTRCGSSPNHAMLLVGYGTDEEKDLDFWVLQNSWGTDWGEEGYVRIKRGTDDSEDGTCGILALGGAYPGIVDQREILQA